MIIMIRPVEPLDGAIISKRWGSARSTQLVLTWQNACNIAFKMQICIAREAAVAQPRVPRQHPQELVDVPAGGAQSRLCLGNYRRADEATAVEAGFPRAQGHPLHGREPLSGARDQCLDAGGPVIGAVAPAPSSHLEEVSAGDQRHVPLSRRSLQLISEPGERE